MKKLAEYMRDGPFNDGDSDGQTTIKVEEPPPEPKKVKSVPPKKVEPPRPVSFKPSKQIMQEIQEEALKAVEETDSHLPQINSTEKKRVVASNLNFLKKAQSRAASQ